MKQPSPTTPRDARPGSAERRPGSSWKSLVLAAAALALPLAGGARAQLQDTPFDAASAERFLAGVTEEQRPYLVHTGARWMLPRPDTQPGFSAAGRAVVYLQFDRALSVEERARLTRAGVRFHAAVTRNTYLARIQRDQVGLLRSHPAFRGLEPLRPVDKLAAPLFYGMPNPQLMHPDGSSDVVVGFHEDVSHAHALAVLDRWDVTVRDRARYSLANRIEVTASTGQVLALAEEPSVLALEEGPWPVQDDNTDAAALSNVDDVQNPPWSLTGAGVLLGIWEVEGNPRTDHPDYSARITEPDPQGDADHATHVAGTMIGDGSGNAAARGMAPAANLDAYSSDNAPTEMFFSWFDGVVAANNSWGTRVGWNFDGMNWTFNDNQNLFGAYTGDTREWDSITGVPIMVQKSSGNDRDDCQDATDPTTCDGTTGGDGQRYDTIPHRGTAKNIITVGATDDTGLISGFSSSGPADDGRVKPDIVANGTGLTSTWAQGVQIDSCTGLDYCSIGGTSMSCPTVTGTIGLLVEKYRADFGFDPTPDLIKALLVNTAMEAGRPGPDYLYGHGILDALAAVETIDVGEVRLLQDAVFTGQKDEFLVEVPPGLGELRVTLAWVDVPGAADSGNPDLINNLDLRLVSPSGATTWPFTGPQGDPTGPATNVAANPVDNVEHARVANPETGYWTVRVDGAGVPVGPQTYALVANSAFFLEDEPNIDVTANLTFPETCVNGGLVKQTVGIFNTGGADLVVHDVMFQNGALGFSVLPNPSPPFVLPPGSHIDVYVAFDPVQTGPVTDTLRIFSTDADEGLYEIDANGSGGVQDIAAALEAKGYFGIVPLGYQETLELQVINQGICDLTVLGLNPSVGGAEFAPGEIDGFAAFPFTLFPGESAVIYVTYLPVDYGFDLAVFNLVTDDPTTPQIPVTLTGECLPPEIVTTGSLRFGEVCPGAFVEKTLDICNTGISDLEVTSVAFAAPCDDFTIVNNPFPATVSHDFCLGVTVRYTPTGVGNHACDLVIESNDPVQPTVTITATGTLLPVSLDVSPDLCFPPTVIQDLADCSSCLSFPITNTGDCPVTVTEVALTQALGEYSFVNLPVLPVTLLPGETLGDGALEICFAPEVVQRYRTATVSVTYETNDPMNGDVATVTRELVGEGVHTGLRMLVRKDGLAMATVDKVELYRVLFPGTVDETLSIVQIDNWQDLQTTLALGPCPAVDFHQEYGGESNPIVLEPGTYLVWVRHNFGQGLQSRKEVVVLDDWCDFEADIALDF